MTPTKTVTHTRSRIGVPSSSAGSFPKYISTRPYFELEASVLGQYLEPDVQVVDLCSRQAGMQSPNDPLTAVQGHGDGFWSGYGPEVVPEVVQEVAYMSQRPV